MNAITSQPCTLRRERAARPLFGFCFCAACVLITLIIGAASVAVKYIDRSAEVELQQMPRRGAEAPRLLIIPDLEWHSKDCEPRGGSEAERPNAWRNDVPAPLPEKQSFNPRAKDSAQGDADGLPTTGSKPFQQLSASRADAPNGISAASPCALTR